MKFYETREALLLVRRLLISDHVELNHALEGFMNPGSVVPYSGLPDLFVFHRQGMVTQRLQKAIEKGWVAKEQMEEAKYVCAVLEARQQEDMEATFGRAEGKS